MSRANWVIIALMVSWLVVNSETARDRCAEAASSRCCSARSATIRSSSRTVVSIWAWIRLSRAERTLSGTLVAERT